MLDLFLKDYPKCHVRINNKVVEGKARKEKAEADRTAGSYFNSNNDLRLSQNGSSKCGKRGPEHTLKWMC